MIRRLLRRPAASDDAAQDLDDPRATAPRRATAAKEMTMQWTTPTATDFRFGFEITMYVAAR